MNAGAAWYRHSPDHVRRTLEQREAERRRALELVDERGRVYCVELAIELAPGCEADAWTYTRAVGRAKGLLIRLEREGVLVGATECVGDTARVRRYYSRPEARA